jgi:Zn-dependent protease
MYEQASKKTAGYWHVVRRFGLPFGLVFLGIDYVVFRMASHGPRYPWGSHLVEDVLMMFVVSTLWWWLRVSKRKPH